MTDKTPDAAGSAPHEPTPDEPIIDLAGESPAEVEAERARREGIQLDAGAMPATGINPDETGIGQAPPRSSIFLRELMRGSAVTTVLAIVIAMIVGGLLVVFTNERVQETAGYFFAKPQDMLFAAWDAFIGGYWALFRGAIIDPTANNTTLMFRPITTTLGFAAPLITAGLGIAVAFRAGLFNIGARGQILIGAAFAALTTFNLGLPMALQIPVTLIAGIVGGALWGGIVGILKARTGAHEVILTIMLNWIAVYLVQWMVSSKSLLQWSGGNEKISMPTPASARFPALFGPSFPALNLGFLLAIVAVIFVWWLVEHSTLGVRLRAVGENPHAARAAGISVSRMYIYAMLFAGGLAGLAGMTQIQGAKVDGFDSTIDAGFGFDAITVALLGRSRAWGTLAAGLLFGALKAGSFRMQSAEGIPPEIVLIVQSLIVLFIAAPPLIRTIFFLPRTDAERIARANAIAAKKAVKA